MHRQLILSAAVLSVATLSCIPDRTVDGTDRPTTPPADLYICTETKYLGMQKPAAMLILLDRSNSMLKPGRWSSATTLIKQLIDRDEFNTTALGLYTAPLGSSTPAPACIGSGTMISCGVPGKPVVDLELAGTLKTGDSEASVRQSIAQWIDQHKPDTDPYDATPLYLATNDSIAALNSFTKIKGKRILTIVTDGTVTNCDNGMGYARGGACGSCSSQPTWEAPEKIVEALRAANAQEEPIESFVIALPAKESDQCYLPPYSIELALSAIAYAGSPSYVASTCDGRQFSTTGSSPSKPCYYAGSPFNAAAFAETVSAVRGKVLSCSFDLPKTPEGTLPDRDRVNVELSSGQGMTKLFRRKSPLNPCLENGCWDYSDDKRRVELIGKACSDVKSRLKVQVNIGIGCVTIIG